MSRPLADHLNQGCFCVSLDRTALEASLRRAADGDGIVELIESRPHLISSAPVFLSSADVAAMIGVMRAAEAATQLPHYRAAVATWSPKAARIDHGPAGALMGYDFHLTEDGPKLIEVNTNAGGAFLNAFIARAQQACCTTIEQGLARDFDAAIVAMFEREWRCQRGAGRPQTIAIVDDAPQEQYLYPEFVLAQRLLQRAGFEAVIVDAADLRFEEGVLRHTGRSIDLVYNRLTDFTLEAPQHLALRDAYEAGAVVLTPNPFNHALHADKRNLTLLADWEKLAAWGLPAQHVEALRSVPSTLEVTGHNAEALWADRKRYFFKPVAGYGGKAVYRGDKLTRSAWECIRAGGYIAQERAEPSERAVHVDGQAINRKLDVRIYAYDGAALLAAARVYQGQTTNFRTPGGGFAPVVVV